MPGFIGDSGVQSPGCMRGPMVPMAADRQTRQEEFSTLRRLHPASFADQEPTACQVVFSLRFYRMGSFVMPS